MKLILSAVFLFVFLPNGFALTCYECDSTLDPTSCDSKKFTRECGEQQVCFKTERLIRDEKIIKKACVDASDETKCETHDDGRGMVETICKCDADLCNNADVKTTSKAVMFSLIVMVFFMQFT